MLQWIRQEKVLPIPGLWTKGSLRGPYTQHLMGDNVSQVLKTRETLRLLQHDRYAKNSTLSGVWNENTTNSHNSFGGVYARNTFSRCQRRALLAGQRIRSSGLYKSQPASERTGSVPP